MPPQSGKTWYRRAGSGVAIRRLSASCASCVESLSTAASRSDSDRSRRRVPSGLRHGRNGQDPQTRKYRRTRLFVMVLGCSRKAARFLTFRSSSRIWAELHEKAFRRLGGATRVVVLDGLREGVLVPDIYDPL